MSAEKFHIQSLKLGEVKEVWFQIFFSKSKKLKSKWSFVLDSQKKLKLTSF